MKPTDLTPVDEIFEPTAMYAGDTHENDWRRMPQMTSHMLDTVGAGRLPITLESGEGALLWDVHGRTYWDFYGGHAVTLIGQGHPRWADAIAKQARTVVLHDARRRSRAHAGDRGAVHVHGHARRVVRELGRRSERSGIEDRAQGDRTARDHRDGARVPRPDDGRARRHLGLP
jgi:hypothetical protein